MLGDSRSIAQFSMGRIAGKIRHQASGSMNGLGLKNQQVRRRHYGRERFHGVSSVELEMDAGVKQEIFDGRTMPSNTLAGATPGQRTRCMKK